MKKQKFFFGEVGLNADIKRHRKEEQELREKLAEYEKAGNERGVQAYRHFLNQLLQSKAEVTSQIGK